MNKSILYTHTDMDGAGCAIIFTLAFYHKNSSISNYIKYCDYNNINDIITNDIDKDDYIDKSTDVYIADICCSREVLEKLQEKANDVSIFDHHQSSLWVNDVVCSKSCELTNTNGIAASGTSLLFNYLQRFIPYSYNWKLMDKLVTKIRDYDTYRWKDIDDKEAMHLNVLFGLLGMDNFVDNFVIRIMKDKHFGINLFNSDELSFILAKVDREDKFINEFSEEDIYPIAISGYNVAVYIGSLKANINELANSFLSKYPNYDAFMLCSFTSKTFSIRSTKDGVALEIAKLIGGGGHPKASGAPIHQGLTDAIIETIVSYCNNYYA